MDAIRSRRVKVLLIHVAEGDLSPETVDGFRERAGREKQNVSFSFSVAASGRSMRLARAGYAISHLLHYFHTLDTFVVVTCQGRIDFDLFGLLLGCDYRICSEDTTFVNRVLDVGLALGSGVLWFLSRFLGYAVANDIMLESKSLTASEAHGLKLMNRVVSADSLKSEALAVAERFAARLTFLTKHIGSGFDKLPAPTPKETL